MTADLGSSRIGACIGRTPFLAFAVRSEAMLAGNCHTPADARSNKRSRGTLPHLELGRNQIVTGLAITLARGQVPQAVPRNTFGQINGRHGFRATLDERLSSGQGGMSGDRRVARKLQTGARSSGVRALPTPPARGAQAALPAGSPTRSVIVHRLECSRVVPSARIARCQADYAAATIVSRSRFLRSNPTQKRIPASRAVGRQLVCRAGEEGTRQDLAVERQLPERWAGR